MLFKMIGSLLILGASTLIGFTLSRDCMKRPQHLRDIQGLLQMFENEIAFLSNLLVDAFDKLALSTGSEAGIFFKETADSIRLDYGRNAAEAWEDAVKKHIGKTALNKEDENILISFGKMLGNSDLEGQIKNIRLTITQLKLQEQKAEENRKKNETMYKNLGILGGLGIVIILL